MATLSVYLDNSSKKKDGTSPVKLIIRNAGTSALLPTGFYVPDTCWKNGKVVSGKGKELLTYPTNVFNAKISAFQSMVGTIVTEVCGYKSSKKAKQIRDLVVARLNGENASDGDSMPFVEVFDRYLSVKKKSTSATCRVAKSYLIKSIPDMESILVSEIDEAFAKKVIATMENDSALKHNTIKSYITIIKAVWHWAQKEELIEEERDPWKRIKIKMQITRSRALTIEEVRELWYAEPDVNDSEQEKEWFYKGRDALHMFIGLAGMNMADLFRLTTEDIQGGRIRIGRSKTGVPIDIRVEPEVMEVFKKYTDEEGRLIGKMTQRTDGLGFDNDEEKPNPQSRAGRKINGYLKRLDQRLTAYWLRHTWASLCAEMDVPDRVISMGLAHAYGNPMDNIYITNRSKKLDEANRRLLDWIQCDPKCD